MNQTVIIDYGFGNLFGLKKAFVHIGAEVAISDRPEDARQAQALVLPGVGAFGDGMAEFNKRGLRAAVLEAYKAGKPILGICLGMQFLFEKSYEFGSHAGLGVIKGDVKKIEIPQKPFCKIPHVGWNSLHPAKKESFFTGPLLQGIAPGAQVYFVHSFAGYPENSIDIIANTYYCENVIPAAVAKENTFGVQFHPEKSGEAGLAILKNFLALI